MSIKTKILLWFLLPSILITFGTATFSYFYIRQIIKQNIFDQLEIAADELQEHIGVFLKEKQNRNLDFSSDGFIRDCTEKITRGDGIDMFITDALNIHLKENKYPLDPDLLAVFVIDFNGRIIGSSELVLLNKDVSGEDYFSETKKRGKYMSDLYYYPETGRNIFEVARLLLSKDEQKAIGIIVNRYDGGILKTITRSGIPEESGGTSNQLEGLGETGELYIANKHKSMITGSRFVKNAMHKQVVDTEGVRAALKNGEGMTGIYPNYRGIQTLGVSRYFEDMGWIVLAEKQVSEAFAPIVRLRNITILIGMVSIIVIVVIALFLAGGVSKPIKKLIEGTKRIASGDLEHPIKVDNRTNEIKELGNSFNLMMKDLRKATMGNKQLFLQVKKNYNLLNSIIEGISDAIFVKDLQGKYLLVNSTFASITKKTKEEILGKYDAELFSPDIACEFVESDRKILTSGKTQIFEQVLEIQNTIKTYLTKKGIHRNQEGNAIGILGIAYDITERKKVEEERQKMQLTLMTTYKLASLGEIATGIAHEINQPLTYISSFVQRLKENLEDDIINKKELKEELNTSYNQICRINNIIEHLKTFGRRDDVVKKQVNIVGILNNALLLMGERIRLRNIKLIKILESNLPMISGSPIRLEQVFINLFQNALDAFPEKTKGAEIHIEMFLSKDQKFIVIKFRDNGIGIEKEKYDRIFEPFFTTKEIGKGTGLGLSITYGIIQEHNGTIVCHSGPIKGAMFTIKLPVITDVQGEMLSLRR